MEEIFNSNMQGFQGSPCEGRHFRSDNDEADTEETSTSGQQDYICHNDILEWAKPLLVQANNHGSLQIICEYYKLDCPPRGSTITFHPLEHLYPLEFHRPDDERLLHISGSPPDLRSCKTMLERAEVLNALMAEEEATTLSAWAISRICVSLRLEHVLTLFAGALLEKQIVFVCSNLGILSASVLSLIPLIRPYQWQSLLMPVLPNDMLDFLEAPVPYIVCLLHLHHCYFVSLSDHRPCSIAALSTFVDSIAKQVGVQNKTSEVQSKLTNAILVDVTNNQVRSPSLPQLPKQDELLSSLVPYHSKLVGEGHSASQRPISECTDEQVEAAKGFMEVLRNYLDSLCSNLHSHIMINVQSNDDEEFGRYVGYCLRIPHANVQHFMDVEEMLTESKHIAATSSLTLASLGIQNELVSQLSKESFIDSFPSCDRPFMKFFVDTQMFSVHTDLVLSVNKRD
ncbi:hypothetical protein Cgig2_015065 [Carnegiea gigantea]|uniref:UDENN domain-containing protein n=1 Tax=Carnegiea gigantea TaxID=171969 RepID=A0A9Q1K6F7_9CARY|nr:hypothetical protein Cgig2_015065 [Carnegiea gigantea]